jgi:hypothetical protein
VTISGRPSKTSGGCGRRNSNSIRGVVSQHCQPFLAKGRNASYGLAILDAADAHAHTDAGAGPAESSTSSFNGSWTRSKLRGRSVGVATAAAAATPATAASQSRGRQAQATGLTAGGSGECGYFQPLFPSQQRITRKNFEIEAQR